MLVMVVGGARAWGDVQLHVLFSDNMVLQRQMAVPVFGTGEPGESIEVAFKDQKKTAIADAAGQWVVRLDPLEAGGPLELTVVGKNRVTIRNVMVGDVWICGGQSNMEWTVGASAHAAQEIAAATQPAIRCFKVGRNPTTRPLRNVRGAWLEASPRTVGQFTAVGYFFARELRKKLDVPIGLISSNWGGTAIEPWISAQSPDGGRAGSNLFNGMIHPLIPFGIKGVIWYQGESNTGRPDLYRTRFPALIADWRKHWGQGDFPFLFVQLANFRAPATQPGDSGWAELREAQAMALKVPQTGMAVAIDIGDTRDIHPRNKQEVGRRLALAAMKVAYGQKDVVGSGPLYQSMSIEGNRIRIHFEQVGGGLVCNQEPLKHFAIAGEDRRFVWASARIAGQSVVVWNESIAKPVAVRYAWAENPQGCNLYNKEGLPTSPFRTDNWERAPMVGRGR
jgi:sialate O-acetylesterase